MPASIPNLQSNGFLTYFGVESEEFEPDCGVMFFRELVTDTFESQTGLADSRIANYNYFVRRVVRGIVG